MRNMLFRDMKRGFCSIAYWLCVLALIVMAFISLKVNMRYHPILPVSGGLTVFLHATALSLGGYLMRLPRLHASSHFRYHTWMICKPEIFNTKSRA